MGSQVGFEAILGSWAGFGVTFGVLEVQGLFGAGFGVSGTHPRSFLGSQGATLGHFWGPNLVWGSWGSILGWFGGPELVLGSQGSIQGHFWGPGSLLESFLGSQFGLGAVLGSWVCFGVSFGILGQFWGHFWVSCRSRVYLWLVLGSWVSFGINFGLTFSFFQRSMVYLWPFLGSVLGPFWGQFWGHFGVTQWSLWGQFGVTQSSGGRSEGLCTRSKVSSRPGGFGNNFRGNSWTNPPQKKPKIPP